MFEWINIKDKLPTENGKYLCCYSDAVNGSPIIEILYYTKNVCKICDYYFGDEDHAGWYYNDSEWGYSEMNTITHWAPLPTAPKEYDT